MAAAVLIVDDSLTVRMDLAEAFEDAGLSPRPCGTVAEARRALAGGEIGLVILDVVLPDGDGLDFLKEIRATPALAQLPVLMLSTESEVRDRIRGLHAGADEYVGKPYDKGHVVARAGELLRGGALRAQEGDPAPSAVLVVDDSPTFREELRLALEAAGYGVLLASTGEDGLRVAAARAPAAILVDGVLPGIDGATVIRKIRLDAALRKTPCVLLTASEDKGAELRALDAGADGFIRKDETLEVVLARLAALLRSAGGSERGDTASLLAPKRVLAADDSVTYLQELAALLRGEGYDVVLARSGEEALDMLAVQAVDCILLDVIMPGIGGTEACRRIKTSVAVRDIPLIMLTSLDDAAAMLEGLGAGADDYISKSSELDVLTARVRAQLRRKQSEDENRRIREELLRREMAALEARAAQELAEARAALVDELEKKNRELEAFGYSVSHDLRAPLRSVDGFSEALEEDHAHQLDDVGRDHLRRIRSAARRMGELIDDLLKLSRISRAELHRERVSLSEIARSIADELRGKDPSRTVAFAIREGLFVEADGRLLRVVLENLLGNAWKFTGKTREPRIEVDAFDAAGERVHLVRDNGAGFDGAYAEKLFRPFQRLHAEADFAGTGIGLSTVHRVVERHGGRVWAEGALGRGATFFFTLPPAARARADLARPGGLSAGEARGAGERDWRRTRS